MPDHSGPRNFLVRDRAFACARSRKRSNGYRTALRHDHAHTSANAADQLSRCHSARRFYLETEWTRRSGRGG